LSEKVHAVEERHALDRDRMEDMNRLKDVLEAVVTGAVKTSQAAYLSAKAGPSQVASFEFLNITAAAEHVTTGCLTSLFSVVLVDIVATSAVIVPVRNRCREYCLHVMCLRCP
jgi:hypothetical protein